MNKAELIQAIVAKSGIAKKDAEAALAAALEAITEGMKAGDKVALVGFGTFAAKERAARTGKNPKTGEAIEIAACKVPTFVAGKALKDAIQ